jgi:hypothetical protein
MDFKIPDIENISLSQAVQLVIEQNKSIKYNPQKFRNMTQEGSAENLEGIITNLVLKKELVEEIEKTIEKYGDPLTIEDLIAIKKDGFGLSNEVIREAMGRSDWFTQLRNKKRDLKNQSLRPEGDQRTFS